MDIFCSKGWWGYSRRHPKAAHKVPMGPYFRPLMQYMYCCKVRVHSHVYKPWGQIHMLHHTCQPFKGVFPILDIFGISIGYAINVWQVQDPPLGPAPILRMGPQTSPCRMERWTRMRGTLHSVLWEFRLQQCTLTLLYLELNGECRRS